MATVGVDSGSLHRLTHSLSRMAWSWIGGRLAPFYIHQKNRVNSSRMHVLIHNWSATKQRPHPQSVAMMTALQTLSWNYHFYY